eukprot:3842179-Rhodomonas_salina.1
MEVASPTLLRASYALSGTSVAYAAMRRSVPCSALLPSLRASYALSGTALAYAAMPCAVLPWGMLCPFRYSPSVCCYQKSHERVRVARAKIEQLSLIHISEPTRPRLI